MNGEHWNDDDFVDRLYGVGPYDAHLAECPECAQRWRRLIERRERVLEPPNVPEALLASQRREIQRRLDGPGKRLRRLTFAAAGATAGVVMLAVLLYRPAPAPVPASPDSELYTEVYSLVQSDEPQAVEPIRALFEVQP
jgi:anti-sigma factor RsiW